MVSVLTTLLRGLVGVAATVLLVALCWTVYIKRDAFASALEPIAGLFSEDASDAPTASGSDTRAPAADSQ